MLQEPCTAARTIAAEQHRLLLEVPHTMTLALAPAWPDAMYRPCQARDIVVVPAEERLLVRVVLVAADDAAGDGVEQILAVRVGANERAAGDVAAVGHTCRTFRRCSL